MTSADGPSRSRPDATVIPLPHESSAMSASCPDVRRTPGRDHGGRTLAVPRPAALAPVLVSGPLLVLVLVLVLVVALAGSMVSAATAGATTTAQGQTVAGSSIPGAPGATAGPQLRIQIDNGHTSTTSGDTLVYTVTIVNLGTDPLARLGISQTVPTGMTFGSADGGGAARADGVHWTADLAPDETVTFHTTMTVTDTPGDLLRLATVACATQTDAERPLVCATHSDELPAGAAAAAAAGTPPAATAEGTSSSPPWVAIGGAVVALAIIGAAGVLLARRRQASAPPTADAAPT